MIIKVEVYQGKGYILDALGRIWEMEIGHDRQPIIRLVDEIPQWHIDVVMKPRLVRNV